MKPPAPISSIIFSTLLSRHYISQPSDHSAASSLSAHCMEIEDFKILILFLAMMNLIGDIWVYQLVNNQLTKKTNTMDDDFIYQRKLGSGRWAEVIMMTVNDKTFSSELIVFRQNKKIEFMQR